ncbi:hypothetical protein COOONC_04273 [Cooperia oncophora]
MLNSFVLISIDMFDRWQEDCVKDDIAILVLEDGLWTVKDGEAVHYIKQQSCVCDSKVNCAALFSPFIVTCHLFQINNHCKKCNACAYAFLCDCMQDAKAGISYEHVHACLMYAREGLFDEEVPIVTDTVENRDDGALIPEQSDGQEDDTAVFDKNKEMLQEFECVNAGLRSKLVSLSKIQHIRVQDHLRKMIDLLKDMDALTTAELALHRPFH